MVFEADIRAPIRIEINENFVRCFAEEMLSSMQYDFDELNPQQEKDIYIISLDIERTIEIQLSQNKYICLQDVLMQCIQRGLSFTIEVNAQD